MKMIIGEPKPSKTYKMPKSRVPKIIVANWKMNPATVKEAKELFTSIRLKAVKLPKVKTIICAPSIFLNSLKPLIKNSKINLGGQDLFYQADGAYTGQISASMLKDAGANYVIIGHSETRRILSESDTIISLKIVRALKEGLKVILCIGESVRDGSGQYLQFLHDQLRSGLEKVSKNSIFEGNIIIAYEPLWAIGVSDEQAPQAQDILHTTLFIKKTVVELFGSQASGIQVLYGGSVTAKIAASILNEGGVSGLLVGRQSLPAEQFGEILEIANG